VGASGRALNQIAAVFYNKSRLADRHVQAVYDVGVCLCSPGNGSKSAGATDADNDDEHISLAPQRSSFLSGCQVKRSAAGPDSKRDRDG